MDKKPGMCPKCRRYQLLVSNGEIITCPLCGHIWKDRTPSKPIP